MAKTILLVEDDEDIATLLRLNLQDEGYQIVHEADGGRPRPAGDAGLGCGDPRFDAARRRWSGDLPAYPPDDPLPAGDYHQRSHQ